MVKSSTIRFEYKDDYEWIRVIDIFPENYRYLYFENSVQGALNLTDHRLPVLEYIGIMARGARLVCPQPQRIVLGGLGSCALLHVLQPWWKHAHFTNIEVNPRVYEVAKRFFRLSSSAHVLIGDFREKLEARQMKPADLILVDCYSALTVPPHLVTLELMFLVHQKLSQDGYAVFNVWSPSCNRFCGEQIRTSLEAFGEIAVVMCREDENALVFAAKDPGVTWPEAIGFKGMAYPLLSVSRHDKRSWPEFMVESKVVDDRNVGRILETVGWNL